MSATPEEFLGQGAYLAATEPFSPSVFLDLPPTPRPDADDDPASSDDLVLPFISRMLMEEDIDESSSTSSPTTPRSSMPISPMPSSSSPMSGP